MTNWHTDFDQRLLELRQRVHEERSARAREYNVSALGILPETGRETLNVRYSLPAGLVGWLRVEAERLGISASEFVEALLETAREDWSQAMLERPDELDGA
jgi:hypothetical protein